MEKTSLLTGTRVTPPFQRQLTVFPHVLLIVSGLHYVQVSQITTHFSFALKISEFEASATFLPVGGKVRNCPPEL